MRKLNSLLTLATASLCMVAALEAPDAITLFLWLVSCGLYGISFREFVLE